MIKHFQNKTQEKSFLEGILFHALIIKTAPLQGRKEIYTLYTKEKGLLSCVYKKQFAPFQVVECHIKKKDEGLSTCFHMDLIDPCLRLRQSFGAMKAASGILKALSLSQIEGMASPLLFEAALLFLKRMEISKAPLVLLASFLLKLLRKEGLLDFTFQEFSPEEKNTVQAILKESSFSLIEKNDISLHLLEKIDQFFKRHIS